MLGVEHHVKALFSTGYGFDSIAIALLAEEQSDRDHTGRDLLGRANDRPQLRCRPRQVSPAMLIRIMQALAILFVAADPIVRWIYRLPQARGEQMVFTRGWGK